MRPERSLKAATASVLLAGTTIAATGAVPAQAAGSSQFTGTAQRGSHPAVDGIVGRRGNRVVDDLYRFRHWPDGAEDALCDAAVRVAYQSGQNAGAFARKVCE